MGLPIVVCSLVFKGQRFKSEYIPDIKTHYKPTGVKRGFIKSEAVRLLKTNSSKITFEECLSNFKLHLIAHGYPKTVIERSLSGGSISKKRSY